MAIERSWEAVGPVAFIANGSADGTVTLSSVAGFKVKQSVVISAISLPDLKLEVKKVISATKLIVGPVVTTGKLLARQNLSSYTLATSPTIRAEEQKKAVLPIADIIQAVYRQEPGTTIGVEIDDQFGNPIDSVKDSNGVNRLAVDGQFTADVDVQVEVQLTAKDNDPDAGDVHDSIRIGDGVDEVNMTKAASGTVVGMNVNSVNDLFSKPFNKLTVLSKNDDGDPLTIRSSYGGIPVQLLTIAYDAEGDFEDAEVSNL